MWDDVVKHMMDFQSAVLTGVDAEGYPFSVRCKPEPYEAEKVLHVQVPEGTYIRQGPAGLLWHKHDELLWNLKSFLVRGILEKDTKGWVLHPQRFTPGMGIGGQLGMLQFMRNGEHTAKRYLKRRGLPRPKIPWDEIKARYAQAKKNK